MLRSASPPGHKRARLCRGRSASWVGSTCPSCSCRSGGGAPSTRRVHHGQVMNLDSAMAIVLMFSLGGVHPALRVPVDRSGPAGGLEVAGRPAPPPQSSCAIGARHERYRLPSLRGYGVIWVVLGVYLFTHRSTSDGPAAEHRASRAGTLDSRQSPDARPAVRVDPCLLPLVVFRRRSRRSHSRMSNAVNLNTAQQGLRQVLGDLEAEIMECMWDLGSAIGARRARVPARAPRYRLHHGHDRDVPPGREGHARAPAGRTRLHLRAHGVP